MQLCRCQKLKNRNAYSLSRRAGVSFAVPNELTRRLNEDTAVLIWNTPDASACVESCCLRPGGIPPASISKKLIFVQQSPSSYSPSATLRISTTPTLIHSAKQILHQSHLLDLIHESIAPLHRSHCHLRLQEKTKKPDTQRKTTKEQKSTHGEQKKGTKKIHSTPTISGQPLIPASRSITHNTGSTKPTLHQPNNAGLKPRRNNSCLPASTFTTAQQPEPRWSAKLRKPTTTKRAEITRG